MPFVIVLYGDAAVPLPVPSLPDGLTKTPWAPFAWKLASHPHAPAEQTSPTAHAFPHPPQCCALELGSTHAPLHVSPLHVQLPALQLGVGCPHAGPAFCHAPLALHDCGCAPEHCASFGVQTPTQAPETQAWFVHAPAVPHWPMLLHASTPLPLQRVDDCVQTPLHTPFTHVCPEHSEAAPQAPLELHVETPLASHFVEPGVQTPVHAPETHAWFVHAAGLLH